MTFVALGQSAMARVGRGDGPAQLDADLIIGLDSGPEGAQTVAKIVRLGIPAGP